VASIIDYLIVLLVAFGFNLIPFAGPSNLLIASNFGIIMQGANTATLVLIGFLIALGAAFAKGIYYIVTFFVNKRLSMKSRQRLDVEAVKIRRWAFPLLFLAAATPIPDEPVVIPLGLMKYNPAKFFTAFFLGKLVITVPGAFLGGFAGDILSNYLNPWVLPVASIVLTIVITVVMFKVDLGKLTIGLLRRKPAAEEEAVVPKEMPISPPAKIGRDYAHLIGLAAFVFGVIVLLSGGLALAFLPVASAGLVSAWIWAGVAVCAAGFLAVAALVGRKS
jgi:membrane protein DedA with SNARE-associated domain